MSCGLECSDRHAGERPSTLSAKRDNAVGKHWQLATSSEKAFPPTASAYLLTYQSLGSIMKQLGGQKDLWGRAVHCNDACQCD
jgi:hypothetical protein